MELGFVLIRPKRELRDLLDTGSDFLPRLLMSQPLALKCGHQFCNSDIPVSQKFEGFLVQGG
ncbi:hypothetical protein Lokhon_02180 [Limimaricola hongkongensis DSM 17492]|uniref:Uncharacterized protein n=1 Tax=Limimaricola hongkongensis DSM 17492 TaxID=1122180 RepID=A0A017H874_9RHOB|nr:hypothetical protein Lokhon_02180 [Limimaricola hongkongensis DSM 17492]